MDQELIKAITYILGGGIVLFLIVKLLANRKGKCSVCKSETQDSYVDKNDKRIILCRNHLIDRWRTDLSMSYENMVVIEPDFVKYPYAYLYADLSKLSSWQYSDKAVNNINSILEGIFGKTCIECQNRATIAYLRKEDYQPPLMEDISIAPTYLCKKCMINKITPVIQNSPKSFLEGVYGPTENGGVYHVQEF